DAQTLPQAFADATEHSVRVLNFAYPGYGPQQFLRPLEAGLFDELLGQHPRAFVYLTAPWHAERAACLAGYVLQAPSYEIGEGGEPVYQGACWQQWRTVARELAANTALARLFAERTGQRLSHAEVDLYISIVHRAGSLARQKYGVPTVILYLPAGAGYLKNSGYTDDEIKEFFEKAGLAVIDATLDQQKYPDQALTMPGDGHPTGLANRARAELVKAFLARQHLAADGS